MVESPDDIKLLNEAIDYEDFDTALKIAQKLGWIAS